MPERRSRHESVYGRIMAILGGGSPQWTSYCGELPRRLTSVLMLAVENKNAGKLGSGGELGRSIHRIHLVREDIGRSGPRRRAEGWTTLGPEIKNDIDERDCVGVDSH